MHAYWIFFLYLNIIYITLCELGVSKHTNTKLGPDGTYTLPYQELRHTQGGRSIDLVYI